MTRTRQLLTGASPRHPLAAAPGFPDPIKLVASTPAPLVQRLLWDFKTTFPQPTEQAIDAGVIDESDCQPENLKSLHENYAGQLISTLRAIDAVLDVRRLGIDPGTGKVPKTHVRRRSGFANT